MMEPPITWRTNMRWFVVLLAALAIIVGYALSKGLGGDSVRLTRALLATIGHTAFAQEHPAPTALALNSVPVTVDNYNRAQTDVYFAGVVKNGGFGKFRHGRELAPPVQQGIVRPNRDTLYSFVIVDLDAGPVTITLPERRQALHGASVGWPPSDDKTVRHLPITITRPQNS
jgi:uncharacterized protein DUF1254